MARIQTPPVLSQIRVARSYSEQAVGLRSLKDEIIGHNQRKEKWVECGILDTLVEILQNNHPPASRLNGKQPYGQLSVQQGTLTDTEVVRLLSLQLLGSFAYGGPQFLQPFDAAGAVPAILANISPSDAPPQLVLAALRALNYTANSAQLAPPGAYDAVGLADAVFSSKALESLYAVLCQESTDVVVQEQKRLVAALISRLCKIPRHQNAIADSGILDALATMLASVVVARGEVIPGADYLGQTDGLASMIPAPAPPGTDLAVILEALSAIVANSRYRSCALLSSPSILAVLPHIEIIMPTVTGSRTAWTALEMSGLGNLRDKNPGAMEFLLPPVPIPQSKFPSSHFAQFPPLGVSPSRDNLMIFSGSRSSGGDPPSEDSEVDDTESPLIPWLIHLARDTQGMERVMALSLLTSLYKAGFASPEREQALAVLVVPLLCQLMKEYDKEISSSTLQAPNVEPDIALGWSIQERAADVLARLVGDSEILQQAAADCGVIKMTVKILKDSYEPQPVQTAPRPWSPNPDKTMDTGDTSLSCRLGPNGLVPAYVHKLKLREAGLKLVAGMATLQEQLRKDLAEADAVPYVVESLCPSPGKPKSSKDSDEGATSGGTNPYGQNPESVLIAACHATRALSRSVDNLRRVLFDNNVAIPIYNLMKHSDVNVQNSACAAVINLLYKASPMLKPLLDAGIIKTLCEHAHSLNAGLRINSLWALKHIVNCDEKSLVDNNLRKRVLEELEPGWLVQLISDDISDEEALQQIRGRSSWRAKDADDDEDMDAPESTSYDETESAPGGTWTWPALSRVCMPLPPRLQQSLQRLSALRDAELNPVRRARNDSLDIQEQAISFIRNFLSIPEEESQPELVDFIFSEIGQDRLFGILADKLRRRVVGGLSRRSRSSSTTGASGSNSNNESAVTFYPQPRVVENIIWVLCHIAAARPQHRQLVLAQKELLRRLSEHFNSCDVGVRRALVQLFENLSWSDGDMENAACQQRAREIEQMGFLEKLKVLEQSDVDKDVRARAAGAVGQLKAPGAGSS